MQKNRDTRELAVVEEAILNYYNGYLFSHGLITEHERNAMTAKIAEREKSKTKKSKLS